MQDTIGDQDIRFHDPDFLSFQVPRSRDQQSPFGGIGFDFQRLKFSGGQISSQHVLLEQILSQKDSRQRMHQHDPLQIFDSQILFRAGNVTTDHELVQYGIFGCQERHVLEQGHSDLSVQRLNESHHSRQFRDLLGGTEGVQRGRSGCRGWSLSCLRLG
jgi:hypothetical protein